MGDGVSCAVAGQKVHDVYHHLDRMLTSMLRHDGYVACLDARGLPEAMPAEGVCRSTLDELTDWTPAAHKVLVF